MGNHKFKSEGPEVTKKIFEILMRIVVVYSFERVRIRQTYIEDCLWYEAKNFEIESAADSFLSSCPPKIDTDKLHVDTENFLMEFKQELVRYFWNFHQYGIKPHNPEIFESLGYQQQQIHQWITKIHIDFVPEIRPRVQNSKCFEDHYNIYSFLVPDQFEQIFFKYYEILKLFEDPSITEDKCLIALKCLIRLIPYFSPFSMQSFTELESYSGEQFGKKLFTVCKLRRLFNVEMTQFDPVTQSVTYLSLEHQPITLIDTILQFLFKHLHHLVHWHFLKYQMTGLHSAERIHQIIQNGGGEKLEQFEQVASLLEAMFTALPKNQKTIYDVVKNGKSTASIMNSLMLFDFEVRFIKQQKIKLKQGLQDNVVVAPKFLRKDKIKFNDEFFTYLIAGFGNIGLLKSYKKSGKFDTWRLELHLKEQLSINGELILINSINGGKIRVNAINHRGLLNKNNMLE